MSASGPTAEVSRTAVIDPLQKNSSATKQSSLDCESGRCAGCVYYPRPGSSACLVIHMIVGRGSDLPIKRHSDIAVGAPAYL